MPYVQGAYTWNWEFFYPMIAAIGAVARDKGISLRWGGVWDRELASLDPENLAGEVADYAERKGWTLAEAERWLEESERTWPPRGTDA